MGSRHVYCPVCAKLARGTSPCVHHDKVIFCSYELASLLNACKSKKERQRVFNAQTHPELLKKNGEGETISEQRARLVANRIDLLKLPSRLAIKAKRRGLS